ncbi:MAG TPA: hypothetical protein VLA56_05930 [Pseudomonadales bacterium]|nr:hypothetical protein [Pseudomonadales bacterium]
MRPCRTPSRTLRALFLSILLPVLLAPALAQAYREQTLQDLTFLAAKRFNRCVEGTPIPRLTALQVRNLVRGNLSEADKNWFRNAANWRFYDRSGQDSRRVLWTIDTRFHDRFDAIVESVLAVETAGSERYRNLGVLLHYMQTVTIPADVVPIFHPRPWRWPAGDRFTQYPMDAEELASTLGDLCAEVLATPADESFETLLDRTAAATIEAIRAPIADMDRSWHAFWEEDEPGRFGSYGDAGNSFGRQARFPCGEETCLLLDDDPIYQDFALSQHRLAVLATMRAMLVLQRRLEPAEPSAMATGPSPDDLIRGPAIVAPEARDTELGTETPAPVFTDGAGGTNEGA